MRGALTRYGALSLVVAAGSAVVAAQTPAPRQRPSLAIVVVLDRSGSMVGAKMDLAKEATKETLSLLGEKDSFGVLTFDYNFQWALRIAEAQNKEVMRDAINRIMATATLIFIRRFAKPTNNCWRRQPK